MSAKHRFLTALVIGIPVSFLVYGWNLMTLPPGTSYRQLSMVVLVLMLILTAVVAALCAATNRMQTSDVEIVDAEIVEDEHHPQQHEFCARAERARRERPTVTRVYK